MADEFSRNRQKRRFSALLVLILRYRVRTSQYHQLYDYLMSDHVRDLATRSDQMFEIGCVSEWPACLLRKRPAHGLFLSGGSLAAIEPEFAQDLFAEYLPTLEHHPMT